MKNQEELRREKARNMRYKKAVLPGLSLEGIRDFIYNAREDAMEVAYALQNDDVLVEAFGDEDEAEQFRVAYSLLAQEMDTLAYDLEDTWIPDCFDDVFVSLVGGADMMGYDSYEGDYFGLDESWLMDAARDEADKRLMRLTKQDMLTSISACLRIALAYIGLKSRYDNLQAGLDIVRGINGGVLDEVKKIDELYDVIIQGKADRKTEKDWQGLCDLLPAQCWIM